MNTPPLMAHRREKPSGSPPRPYIGYRNGEDPYWFSECPYSFIAFTVSSAGSSK